MRKWIVAGTRGNWIVKQNPKIQLDYVRSFTYTMLGIKTRKLAREIAKRWNDKAYIIFRRYTNEDIKEYTW